MGGCQRWTTYVEGFYLSNDLSDAIDLTLFTSVKKFSSAKATVYLADDLKH